MARPHDAKVALVERGELWLAKSLHDGEDGGVDEADPQIAVGRANLCDTAVVLCAKILDAERSAPDVLEQVDEDLETDVLPAPVIDLREDRARNHPPLARGYEEIAAGFVMLVVGVERSD